MKIRNLNEVNAALSPYVAKNSRLFDKDIKLERTLHLLGAVGDPHKALRIVHVAGTSGKTSTSYYMTELLKAAGKKVGLTVSPHVDSVNERVQVDGQPLPEEKFCSWLGEFLDKVDDIARSDPPSYFELLAAFAFWVFKKEGVDYAVLETGLGGLYDATNVADRQDKVCIITDIGFDHMHVLGDTLPKIAAQKAGIIHDQNHVFMYGQAASIMRPIRARAKQYHAHLHVLDEQRTRQMWHKELTDMADYQQRNWLLAHEAYLSIEHRDGLNGLTASQLAETQAVRIPGRMDVTKVGRKTVIMDGAHNTQKMTAFINSFQRLYPGTKPAVLLSLKDNKEYRDLIPLLRPFSSRIITTTFQASQDMVARPLDPDLLAESFRQAGNPPEVKVIPEAQQAYQALLDSPEEICVVTGSFYLLNQLRNGRT